MIQAFSQRLNEIKKENGQVISRVTNQPVSTETKVLAYYPQYRCQGIDALLFKIDLLDVIFFLPTVYFKPSRLDNDSLKFDLKRRSRTYSMAPIRSIAKCEDYCETDGSCGEFKEIENNFK